MEMLGKKAKGVRRPLLSIWKSHFLSLELFPYPHNREITRLASSPMQPKGLCFCGKGQKFCDTVVSPSVYGQELYLHPLKLRKMNCLITTNADRN